MRVYLSNNFHGTSTTCYVKKLGYNWDIQLSASQAKRAADRLYGIADCTCGDAAGTRPSQGESLPDGSYRVLRQAYND